jgi:sugar-specific transcriptional regulator TrmB
MTGYAVAKETLVPQPKVYETLGRLVERGAVLQVSGSPAKFVAVAPARVLSELEREFRQRLATVELEVSRMRRESDQVQELRLYKETNSWIEIVSAASHLISGAAERIYVSGHGAYLDALGEALYDAREELPVFRGQNEQGMALAGVAYEESPAAFVACDFRSRNHAPTGP